MAPVTSHTGALIAHAEATIANIKVEIAHAEVLTSHVKVEIVHIAHTRPT